MTECELFLWSQGFSNCPWRIRFPPPPNLSHTSVVSKIQWRGFIGIIQRRTFKIQALFLKLLLDLIGINFLFQISIRNDYIRYLYSSHPGSGESFLKLALMCKSHWSNGALCFSEHGGQVGPLMSELLGCLLNAHLWAPSQTAWIRMTEEEFRNLHFSKSFHNCNELRVWPSALCVVLLPLVVNRW